MEADPRRPYELVRLLQDIAVASNEAASPDTAFGLAVRRICAFTGWPVGHVYELPEPASPRLVSTGIWHAALPAPFETLRAVSMQTTFGRGEGLPGRVWATGRPEWIVDVHRDPDFPRARLAREIGIRSAFAFPALAQDEVVAVLEFFAAEPHAPDHDLLDVVAHVGTQLGRVVERERARRALLASEERYRTLAAAAVDAIVVTGYDSVVREWNRAAEAMFGYTKDEIVGRDVKRIMPERYREGHDRGMGRLRETGEAHVIGRTVELHGLRKNGEEFPLELSLSRWRAGGETLFTGIMRDITERHAAAEALLRSRRELERLNDELQRSNRELQDFAYVASHDLQEPLRKIHSFADLLAVEHAPALDEGARAYLERIQHAALRMSTLILDLLAFSRVHTKGQPFHRLDLGRIVRDVLVDLEEAVRAAGADVVVVDDLPEIEADPTQMRQLFQNLVGNALKYRSPDAAPQMWIRGRVEAEPDAPLAREGPVAVLEVEDNGIGFDEKYLDRIFTPFQRLHARDAYGGTGIGLAICRRIVDRHGGTVTARSAPGRGSTFVIRLPVHQVQEGDIPAEAPEADAPR